MAIEQPTKVEAVSDLMSVVNFDPTEGLAPTQVMCPDCKGVGGLMGSSEDDDGSTPVCGTCRNSGSITIMGWDFKRMTPAFRRNIQDIKHDLKGRVLLTFRNKDKAASELKAMLGWDRPDAFNRDASGRALTSDEIAQRELELLEGVASLSKDKIIAQLLLLSQDPLLSATERTKTLETVARLKGFLDEEGESLPDAPPLSAYYDGEYSATPSLNDMLVDISNGR